MILLQTVTITPIINTEKYYVLHGGINLETWLNELLKEGQSESPNGFTIKSQTNNC